MDESERPTMYSRAAIARDYEDRDKPEVFARFYEPRRIRTPGGFDTIETPELVHGVNGRTAYCFTRHHANKLLNGKGRPLNEIYELLLVAEDDKNSQPKWNHRFVVVPYWFRRMLLLLQRTQEPTLFGLEVKQHDEDYIYLSDQ